MEPEDMSVLLIGVGALGSAFLNDLPCKFRKIGIFDGDIVMKENIRTQPFYSGCRFDTPVSKAEFAADVMRRKDTGTEYVAYDRYFTEKDAGIMNEYDLVLDFTDNLKSRLVINKLAVESGLPSVFASLNLKEEVIFFHWKDSACFNCVLRNSSGRVREGCDSLLSAPDVKAKDFLYRGVMDFIRGKANGSEMRVLNLSNGNELAVHVLVDPECEECAKHSFSIDDGRLIQACASGIKFSLGSGIDLASVRKLFPGGEAIGEYLIYRGNGKSVLASQSGDFLFTGYGLEEAKSLLSSLLGSHSYK